MHGMYNSLPSKHTSTILSSVHIAVTEMLVRVDMSASVHPLASMTRSTLPSIFPCAPHYVLFHVSESRVYNRTPEYGTRTHGHPTPCDPSYRAALATRVRVG